MEADGKGLLINDPLIDESVSSIAEQETPHERLNLIGAALEKKLASRHRLDLTRFYADRGSSESLFLFGMCLLGGAVSNYLGTSGEVNLLANPFMALLFWNLLVFVYILFSKIFRLPSGFNTSLGRNFFINLRMGLSRLWPGAPMSDGAKRKTLHHARFIYWRLWFTTAGPWIHNRLAARLHGMAAMLVFGVIGGLYLRGFIKAYTFSWESTFIKDPDQMRSMMEVLFGPALFAGRLLFPQGLPTFDAGDGAVWIHLMAWTALLYVVIPRGMLALLNLTNAERHAQKIHPDLNDPFFRKLITAAGGAGRQFTPVFYGYSPDDRQRAAVDALARSLWGSRMRGTPAHFPQWGEEDVGFVGDHFFGVLMLNGAQTPEVEVHGVFLSQLLDRVEQAHGALLVCVDSSKLDAQREASRQQAWRDAMPSGLQFLWRDFSKKADDGILADAANAVRSFRP